MLLLQVEQKLGHLYMVFITVYDFITGFMVLSAIETPSCIDTFQRNNH